jgi:hypothetical protein
MERGAAMMVDGFNAPKKTAPHFGRRLGLSQSLFGARVTAKGLKYDGKDGQEPIKPNRRDRRAMTANARAVPKLTLKRVSKAKLKLWKATRDEKKNLQRMVKMHRPGAQYAKKPHASYFLQYLPPEEQVKYKEEWTGEQREAADRYLRNMLKRARKALRA